MALNYKISYHLRQFLVLMFFSWAMVACFVTFQYCRERQLKAESIDNMLQVNNLHIIDALENENYKPDELTLGIPRLKGLRITILNLKGDVLFDNAIDAIANTENHINRPEIAQAENSGSGYTLRRRSASTDKPYFYSATKGKKYIVRSAVPYDHSLTQMLATDSDFLWIMLSITALFSVIGYFVTLKSGEVISRLNDFAARAEKGERIYADLAFPKNELGSISSHIVKLYSHLQEAIVQRDIQHEKAIFEQQEKIRIKRQLTNNINHELKTPVAAILVCLETIIEHPELDPEKKQEFIQRAYSSADRLRSLLNDVSLITRMEDGNIAIDKKEVSLAGIIAESIDESKLDHPDSEMEIITNLPDGELTIKGNEQILISVFRNLLDNAIEYSAGTQIDITVTETNDAYAITLADNGKGVAEEHLPHLFERFYRIDKGRSRLLGGTGLGLSIVKNAVLLHGGNITVKNKPQGGLQFDFTLSK